LRLIKWLSPVDAKPTTGNRQLCCHAADANCGHRHRAAWQGPWSGLIQACRCWARQGRPCTLCLPHQPPLPSRKPPGLTPPPARIATDQEAVVPGSFLSPYPSPGKRLFSGHSGGQPRVPDAILPLPGQSPYLPSLNATGPPSINAVSYDRPHPVDPLITGRNRT